LAQQLQASIKQTVVVDNTPPDLSDAIGMTALPIEEQDRVRLRVPRRRASISSRAACWA